jgi:AraC family transcriptional regulator
MALRKVMDYVESNLGERLSLDNLARQVHLSTHHFGKLFKASTGASPMQYVLRQRVQRALELLRTGNFRVAEVAIEVGFFDQSHLDRHCRKFFGAPPKVLLKRHSS